MRLKLDMNLLRPLTDLNAVVKLYPNAAKFADEFRVSRGKDLPKWPDWCFLPMAAWYGIVCHENNVFQLDFTQIGNVARLAAIMTWRYTQGIYRLDPDLLDALTNSLVAGTIPSEVLFRLPEWSVYIETPGRQWSDDIMYGFWAHLEWDPNTERNELRLLLDCEKRLIPIPIHLGAWTITEAVDRMAGEASKQARTAGVNFSLAPDFIEKLSGFVNPLISVLLYLCSEEPEIDNEREPGVSPARPAPKKTKRGWRLFPPEKPRIWSVGNKIGEQLRQAALAGNDESKGTVRTHVRRGHWHGYWLGPRASERRFVYRWLSPLVVAGKEERI